MKKAVINPRTKPNFMQLEATVYATREMLLRHIRNIHKDSEVALKIEYEAEYERQLKKLRTTR